MSELPTPPIEQIVSAAFELRRDIADKRKALTEVEAAIIARGRGKYVGLDELEVVKVVAPAKATPGKVTYTLTSDNEAAAIGIAGEHFAALFDRRVEYTPCKGFEHVVPKLLPERGGELLALCKTVGKPFEGRPAQIVYP